MMHQFKKIFHKLHLDKVAHKLHLNNIKLGKNFILVMVAVLAVGVTVFLFLGGGGMSAKSVAQKSVNYVDKNLLQQGQTATLVSYSEESGLIKLKINIGGKDYDSYATKDGKIFLPQGFLMDAKAGQATTQNQNNTNTASNQPSEKAASSLAKVDKPFLEAYIVSRCPFGMQWTRAAEEVLKNIPALAGNIKVRYMETYLDGQFSSMHGSAEELENRRQICVREEQPDKYWAYTACQLKADGKTTECEKAVGIDSNKLASCLSDKNRGLKYSKEDADLTLKYGITGSPTLVLNGTVVGDVGRSADALKTAVCNSFVKQPDFCSKQLNTADAATSFSASYSVGPSNQALAKNDGPAPACGSVQ